MSERNVSAGQSVIGAVKNDDAILIDVFAGRFPAETIKNLNDNEIEIIVFECFLIGRADIIEYVVRIKEDFPNFFLTISDDVHPDPSVVTVTVTHDRDLRFVFSGTLSIFAKTYSALVMLISWHFYYAIPLFIAYARSGYQPGSTYLNLADDPHHVGLAYCNSNDETSLIPDPYFFRLHAYSDLKQTYQKTELNWEDRIDAALWRGSNTGEVTDENILNLPRMRLCLYAKQYEDVLDCGVTAIVQKCREEDGDLINNLGLVKNYIPVEEFNRWKFQIDIDGMTNSWPGLFSKMLSKSVVLKVDSSKGWKQWYYDRLVPWKHYIPVRRDFSDLKPILEFLVKNQKCAETIATEAQELMLSFTYDNEIALAHGNIEKEFLKNSNK